MRINLKIHVMLKKDALTFDGLTSTVKFMLNFLNLQAGKYNFISLLFQSIQLAISHAGHKKHFIIVKLHHVIPGGEPKQNLICSY